MEHVRKEILIGASFSVADFEAAFDTFRVLYGCRPEWAYCSPDVLSRYCELFERATISHQHSTRLRYDGIPLAAAILAPGTIAFEGEVDDVRMGDW